MNAAVETALDALAVALIANLVLPLADANRLTERALELAARASR